MKPNVYKHSPPSLIPEKQQENKKLEKETSSYPLLLHLKVDHSKEAPSPKTVLFIEKASGNVLNEVTHISL